jgi:hypothetical protein
VTKRTLAWIVVAFLAAASCIGFATKTHTLQEIKLTQEEVQGRINTKLPLEKNGMVLSNLQVNFENQFLGVKATFQGSKWGQEFNIDVDIHGMPYYEKIDGAFHFRADKVAVSKITFKGDKVSTKVEKFVDKYVDSPKLNQNASEIGNKIEDWINRSIESTTIFVLQRIPIYTLPDTLKGNVVRMSLQSVEINDSVLILHLSFWQFTKMVLIYIVIFVIALVVAFALVVNPEWGLAAMFISSMGDINS